MKWKAAVPGTRVWTCVPAFGPNGNLYVGSSEGVVWSFDPYGKVRWRGDFPGISGISPIVVAPQGFVYGLGRDLSLSAISLEGKLLWRTDSQAGGLTPPLIAPDGGAICVETLSGKIRRYLPDGTLRWEYSYQPGASIRCEPCVDASGNTIVNTTINMQNFLQAISIDGRPSWQRPCGVMFNSVGVDTKNRVWVFDGDPSSSKGGLAAQTSNPLSFLTANRMPRGYLTVLDSSSGKVLGQTRTPFYFPMLDGVDPRPDGSIMTIGDDGVLYCYDL
jgi:hypothetical protein